MNVRLIRLKEATSIQSVHAVEHNLIVGEILIAEYSLNGWIGGQRKAILISLPGHQ